jgi:rubrerythrin
MKNIALLALLGIIAFTGCRNKPERTIANLQTAVVDEATANARYTAFAAKAREEGYQTIAKLFDATSRAEKVHSERYKEFLDQLDAPLKDFQPQYELKSTAENLQTAIDLETREVNSVYPKFMTDATAEKMDDIAETMGWSMSMEKKHLQLLIKALTLLKTAPDSLNTLATGYTICPVCGNTCDSLAIEKTCPNCQTSSDIYIGI